MKNVLITGGSGFIGSQLTKRCISSGITPHLITQKTSSHWRLKSFENKYISHNVELTDESALGQLLKSIQPDTIFHLASHGVIDAKASTEHMCKTNILGTFSLLQSCKDIPLSAFIYTGTCFEYTHTKETLIREDDEPHPFTLYGATKFTGTMAVQWATRALNLPTTIIRPFTTYGPFEDSTRLVIRVARHILHNKSPHIAVSDPVRDFVFVEDMVEALIAAAEHAQANKGEIINISTAKEHHLSDIADILLRQQKSKLKIAYDETSKYTRDHFHWAADNSKAKRLLGWEPNHTLEEGLLKTYEWLKAHDFLYPPLV